MCSMFKNMYAFPSEQGSTPNGEWNGTYDPGMTMWEYYAGQALCGLSMFPGFGSSGDYGNWPDNVAAFAAEIADKMILERQKRIETDAISSVLDS